MLLNMLLFLLHLTHLSVDASKQSSHTRAPQELQVNFPSFNPHTEHIVRIFITAYNEKIQYLNVFVKKEEE